MSEADTSNNQPFPEPTAPNDQGVADLSEAIGKPENVQIVKFSVLSDWSNAIHQPEQDQEIELDSTTAASSTTAEADDHAMETRTKDADWFALAQKMRQRNRRLLDQVTELRAALGEKQEALHLEQMRSRDRDMTLAQQTEELNTLQEQLTRLFHALESSHQAAQRQQILIETLSEQLQSSQERVAQLERECALTQQRYNEQSHQLLQAANTCRELRTRLHRQQQQTLQFKTALEKSLEMPSSAPPTQQQPRYKIGYGIQSPVPKAQPIQPWSAEPEVVEDTFNLASLWNRPIQLEPPSAIFLSQPEPSELRRVEELMSATVEVADAIETTGAPSEESIATEQELEQQLLAEMASLAEASGLSEFQPDLVETEASLIPLGTNADQSESASYWSDTEETASPSPEESRELEAEAEMSSQELWEDLIDGEPVHPDDVILPQPNSPSPVLYPLRPPKKLKSLSAIELPSFPRFRPS